MCHGNDNFPLEVLFAQRLEQTRADSTWRKHVHVLQPLKLTAGKALTDFRMVSANDTGKAFVHEMLYDEIVGRRNDPTDCHRGCSGRNAGLSEIIAEWRHTKFDARRLFTQPCDQRWHQDQLHIAVWRDQKLAVRVPCVKILLMDYNLIQLRQCGFNRWRDLLCKLRRFDAVSFADEQWITEHVAKAIERVRERWLRYPEPGGSARHAAFFHKCHKNWQQIKIILHRDISMPEYLRSNK